MMHTRINQFFTRVGTIKFISRKNYHVLHPHSYSPHHLISTPPLTQKFYNHLRCFSTSHESTSTSTSTQTSTSTSTSSSESTSSSSTPKPQYSAQFRITPVKRAVSAEEYEKITNEQKSSSPKSTISRIATVTSDGIGKVFIIIVCMGIVYILYTFVLMAIVEHVEDQVYQSSLTTIQRSSRIMSFLGSPVTTRNNDVYRTRHANRQYKPDRRLDWSTGRLYVTITYDVMGPRGMATVEAEKSCLVSEFLHERYTKLKQSLTSRYHKIFARDHIMTSDGSRIPVVYEPKEKEEIKVWKYTYLAVTQPKRSPYVIVDRRATIDAKTSSI